MNEFEEIKRLIEKVGEVIKNASEDLKVFDELADKYYRSLRVTTGKVTKEWRLKTENAVYALNQYSIGDLRFEIEESSPIEEFKPFPSGYGARYVYYIHKDAPQIIKWLQGIIDEIEDRHEDVKKAIKEIYDKIAPLVAVEELSK